MTATQQIRDLVLNTGIRTTALKQEPANIVSVVPTTQMQTTKLQPQATTQQAQTTVQPLGGSTLDLIMINKSQQPENKTEGGTKALTEGKKAWLYVALAVLVIIFVALFFMKEEK